MPFLSDYLLKTSPAVIQANLYVRLLNNATGVSYISDGVTDANGKFTFTANIPPAGLYTVFTGGAPTIPGTPTPTGDTQYLVSDPLQWGGTWFTVSSTTNPAGPAVGDGVADDLLKLQAAEDAANASPVVGGVVYYPATRFYYRVTNSIRYYGGIRHVGAGRTTTYIRGDGAFAVFVSNTPGSRIYSPTWEHLAIQNGANPRAQASSVCIDLTNVSTATMFDVQLSNAVTLGIINSSVGAFYNNFIAVRGNGCVTGWLVDANECHWYGCSLSDITGIGVNFNSGSTNSWDSGAIEGFTGGVAIRFNAPGCRAPNLRLDTGTTGVQVTANARSAYYPGLWTTGVTAAISAPMPAATGLNANITSITFSADSTDRRGRITVVVGAGGLTAGTDAGQINFLAGFVGLAYATIGNSSGYVIMGGARAVGQNSFLLYALNAWAAGTYTFDYQVAE